MVLTVMKTMTLGTNRNLLHFHSLSSLFPFIHTQKEEKKASNVICIYTFWSTQKYTVPRVLYMKKSIKKELAVADLPLPLSSLSLSSMYMYVYRCLHIRALQTLSKLSVRSSNFKKTRSSHHFLNFSIQVTASARNYMGLCLYGC